MGFFDDLKKKAEKLAAGAAEWTTQAAKDTAEWTTQAAKDTAEWTSEKWEGMGKYAEDFQNWTKELPDRLQEFKDNFSIEDFWNKIKETALSAGQEVVFMALTIYYSIANQMKSGDNQPK